MGGNRKEKAQLGCGTLILVALIVLIFSGGGQTRDLTEEVKMLHREVSRFLSMSTISPARPDCASA